MFKKTFLQAYPHTVKMVSKKAKLDSITIEGMVQFCMIVPMKNDPLPWESEDLAALTPILPLWYNSNTLKQKATSVGTIFNGICAAAGSVNLSRRPQFG